MAENTGESQASKPTAAEIAKAWGTQGGLDARVGHNADADVAEKLEEKGKDAADLDSRRIEDVQQIPDAKKQQVHEEAMAMGANAAKTLESEETRKAIELAAAKDKGRAAEVRTRIKHAFGR